MSEDYKQGFKEGFQAGVDAAMKANIPQRYYVPTQPYPIPNLHQCHVCGRDMSKPMSVVCVHSSCPTRLTCGAIGASDYPTTPPGAVGAAGPL